MIEEEFRVFISELAMLLGKMDNAVIGGTAVEIAAISNFPTKLASIHTGNIMDDSEIKNLFWDDFEHFIESLDPSGDLSRKVIAKQQVPVVWGFWKWLHEVPLPHGFSPKHVELLQGPSNPSGRHVYRARPKRVSWRLHPVTEGGKVKYFTTVAPICEIDAVCSVPSMTCAFRPIASTRSTMCWTSSAEAPFFITTIMAS